MSMIPENCNFDALPDGDFQGLQAFAECLWANQANLIKGASDHFGKSPELIAAILLPVVFQAMAGAFPDKAEFRAMVDDWLRSVPHKGAAQ